MLPIETLRRIRGIHFKARHLANDFFAGLYGSAFKGQGIEFSDVRSYLPGDDTKLIDWNVSARFGHPFVKVFQEERELTVMLLLDLSGSLLFGTRKRLKREVLAEVAGMLAFLAIRTNDRVGAVLFSSRVEKYIPPKKGPSHVWRLIREIFSHEPLESGTDIGEALYFLDRVLKRRAVVFLISDFLQRGFENSLKQSSRKHEVNLIRIEDPAERELDHIGLISVFDPETGEEVLADTKSKSMRQDWAAAGRNRNAGLSRLSGNLGTSIVELSTEGDVVQPLVRLFKSRRGRAPRSGAAGMREVTTGEG